MKCMMCHDHDAVVVLQFATMSQLICGTCSLVRLKKAVAA